MIQMSAVLNIEGSKCELNLDSKQLIESRHFSFEMADYSEKCGEDCSFDYNEDKQKGVCSIKKEFIIEDHIRYPIEQSADSRKHKLEPENVSNAIGPKTEEPEDKKPKVEEKKEKHRGQNKARPPPFKPVREHNLCPKIADQVVGEPEKKCGNPRCEFLHDRAKYLKIKPADIGTECSLFNLTGRCPRGAACRVGGKHLTEDGLNIINEEKVEEYKKKPPPTRNQLSKDLQNLIRKRKYNFSKAEKIVKANHPPRKKDLEENKSETPTESTESKETTKPNSMRNGASETAKDSGTTNNTTNGNEAGECPLKIEKEEERICPVKIEKDEERICSVKNEKDEERISAVKTEKDEERICSVKTEKEEERNCPVKIEKDEQRMGPVEDYDLIKRRDVEKKRIDWRNKILLSPLTTVGNLPFRRICKEFGADITCGEMALAPKILQGASEEWALVRRHECEDIFGVQLCGNNPGVLARCAQLLNEETEIDYIDLNLGCPIDLIYSQGGGSGMLNRLNVLETVVKSVSQVLDIPLSVKTRMGVYIEKPVAHNLMPKFRSWGVDMITVHGRSREQRYTKLADWEYIERCAKAAHPIPVFGNGDILSYDDYQRVSEKYTSVQGLTIGRGALIKPWIFSEIKEKKLMDVSSSERFDILKKYVNYGLEHWGSDTRGVETTRRFLLEWISFLHRYVPVGILERPPQRINERPPYYRGRDDMETLMASTNCADWIKISEMLLGKVPGGFHFLPKHKANSWK